MHDIGYRDVESYIRSLVSEEFGKPFEEAGDQSEPAEEADEPNNKRKEKRNDAGS